MKHTTAMKSKKSEKLNEPSGSVFAAAESKNDMKKNYKKCVVCGAEFYAPPSSKKNHLWESLFTGEKVENTRGAALQRGNQGGYIGGSQRETPTDIYRICCGKQGIGENAANRNEQRRQMVENSQHRQRGRV